MSKPQLSAVCMAFGAVSMAMLLHQSGQIWYLVLSVLLLAVAESANPLNWAIMGDFFGRRAFATLRGWQHLPDQLMSMSTPVWMGSIFDHTGSYYWSLLPLAIIYGLSACVYWLLPSPPHRPDSDSRCIASRQGARPPDVCYCVAKIVSSVLI